MEGNEQQQYRSVPEKKYKRGVPRNKGEGEKGDKPNMRIVQAVYDMDGEEEFLNVGGIWKNVSKDGDEYLNIRVGHVRLVGFPREQSKDPEKPLPAYGVCMKMRSKEGKVETKSVGALWKNKSQTGKVFYNLTFGDLRLLVFDNE